MTDAVTLVEPEGVGGLTVAPGAQASGRWQLLLRSASFRAGVVLALPVILVALFGRYVAPYDPTEIVGAPLSAPDSRALLGTDDLGRDALSRFLWGGWSLIWLSFAATIVGVGLGAVLGSLLAYVGGVVDDVAMWLTDAWLAFPLVILALLVLSIVGPSDALIVAVVAAGHLPRTLRLVRAAGLAVVRRDFIQYCEAIGVRRLEIVTRELLPNVIAPLTVEFGIRFTWSIGALASLSFLGMGVQPPTPDWGLMINENRIALQVQPWVVLAPLLAISLLGAGIMLMVDGVARVVGGVESRAR